MSLQELDSVMAKSLTSVGAETTGPNPSAKTAQGKVSWFESKYPHFFTKTIVDGRTTKLAPPQQPLSKKQWEPVGKKVGHKQKTYVALHRDPKDGAFFFKFQSDDATRLPIGRDILVIAIAAVKGSEWVQMKAGGHTLCLHRAELRIAFKKLES